MSKLRCLMAEICVYGVSEMPPVIGGQRNHRCAHYMGHDRLKGNKCNMPCDRLREAQDMFLGFEESKCVEVPDA